MIVESGTPNNKDMLSLLDFKLIIASSILTLSWLIINCAKIPINKNINPKIIPRNHIIDKLLKEAENNNYKNINTYLKLLKNPYNNVSIPEIYTKPPSEEEKISFTYCGT